MVNSKKSVCARSDASKLESIIDFQRPQHARFFVVSSATLASQKRRWHRRHRSLRSFLFLFNQVMCYVLQPLISFALARTLRLFLPSFLHISVSLTNPINLSHLFLYFSLNIQFNVGKQKMHSLSIPHIYLRTLPHKNIRQT